MTKLKHTTLRRFHFGNSTNNLEGPNPAMIAGGRYPAKGRSYVEIMPERTSRSGGRQNPADEAPFSTRDFLGVNVSVCRRNEVIAFLLRRMTQNRLTKLAFANIHMLGQVSEPDSKANLDSFVVLNDGIGLDLASIALYRSRFLENLNGTDLIPSLLRAAGHNTRVFLYGASPNIVENVRTVIAEQCQVNICGACDGYGVTIDPQAVPGLIRESAADIVLVALGNPKQENWIEAHGSELNAPLVIGVGALFDILAGAYPRAPRWVRRARLEWMHRLCLEPGRLWRRYTIEALRSYARILLYGARQKRLPGVV